MYQDLSSILTNIFLDLDPKKIFYNKNAKNKTVTFSLGDSFYFCKLLKREEFKREITGYNTMKKYYPISNLVWTLKYKKNYLLIFEYEKTITKNNGLLVDLFSNKTKLDKDFFPILRLYKKVFLKTLKKDIGETSDVFFINRIETRLNKYYTPTFLKSFANKKINFNRKSITINPEQIIENINIYFNNSVKKKWCVLSQCDPNDLNIGTKPIIFDYLAGGSNPLTAEFATLFWYNICQGSYLSLKYNKAAFLNHEKIFNQIDTPTFQLNKIRHYPSIVRIDFIKAYTTKVIMPCFLKIKPYMNWYEEFKNYLSMKILAVFDVSKMEYSDTLLSLAYLEYFYSYIKPKNPEELVAQTLELWKNGYAPILQN